MQKIYINPEMNVQEFSAEDVITTSTETKPSAPVNPTTPGDDL